MISSIALLGAVLGMGPTILSVPLIGRSGVSSPGVSRQQDLPLPKRQRPARPGISKYKAARQANLALKLFMVYYVPILFVQDSAAGTPDFTHFA